MPQIERAPERQTVSSQLFQTPSREPLKQQPQLVMYARGGRAVSGGDAGAQSRALAQLFKYGGDVLRRNIQKQNEEDFVRGKTLQMQGKTVDELEANGESAWTMYGYKTMQANTLVQTWYGQQVADIDTKYKEVDPDYYREHMVEQFRGMLGDDTQANYLLTKVAEQRIPDLAAKQIKAHSAWAHGQALQSYQDTILATAAAGGDVTGLITADMTRDGISKAEQQQIVANAAIARLKNGNTDIYTAAYGVPPAGDSGALGSLAARFESSGSSATIGRMSTDGRAFGKYQLSEKQGTFDAFLRFLEPQDAEAAQMLKDPATREENWKHLVAEGRIQKYEQPFIMASHYRPAHDQLKPELRQMVDSSPALQEVLMSTAIQHGAAPTAAGAGSIFNKVYRPGMTEEDIISAVYDERKTRFGSSTPKERQAVQARLDKEKQAAIGMASVKGLPIATVERLASAYNQNQMKAASEMVQSAQLESERLLISVQDGSMTEYEAREAWDAYLQKARSDPRTAFQGVSNDLEAVNLDFQRRTIPAREQSKAKMEREQRVRMAVLNDAVADLPKAEQMQAWDIWKNTLTINASTKMAQGMPAEQAQEWANNQFLLQARKWGTSVDARTAREWTTAALSPIDSEGAATQEAVQALDMFTRLQELAPGVANKYITNPEAKAVMYTAAELYKLTASADSSLKEAVRMVKDGKTAKSLADYVKDEGSQAAINEAVQARLDDFDPGLFSTALGLRASTFYEVLDADIQKAAQSPEFRRMVNFAAGRVKWQNPGMPPEAVAELAVSDVMNRAEYVMGNMLVQSTPTTLLEDMGMQGFQQPMVVNDAVLKFLQAKGKQMFGDTQWDAGYPWNATWWRDSPEVRIMYNSTDKLFNIAVMVDRDTGQYSQPFPVKASTIGKWYMEQHRAGTLEQRDDVQARDARMQRLADMSLGIQ